MMKDDFNEVRVTEAAEHIRKKLTAFIEVSPGVGGGEIVRDCPAYKNGLTMIETELAIIRALGLLVLDGTQHMFRFQTELDEDEVDII